jgi:hypothetical protein
MASRLGALAGVTAAACGLGDVFATPGPANVLIRYCGDTTLQTGVVAATLLRASANGVPLSSPRLRFSISDTTILRVIAAGESIVGKQPGRATLTVQLESSMLTDTLPTLAQPLHVIGGPAGTPGCP